MKQIQYTEKQKFILEILNKVGKNETSDELWKKLRKIKEEYEIPDLYLTLREWLDENAYRAYDGSIFFTINGKNFRVYGIDYFLEKENIPYAHYLYEYYVISEKAITKREGSMDQRPWVDFYLELALKED